MCASRCGWLGSRRAFVPHRRQNHPTRSVCRSRLCMPAGCVQHTRCPVLARPRSAGLRLLGLAEGRGSTRSQPLGGISRMVRAGCMQASPTYLLSRGSSKPGLAFSGAPPLREAMRKRGSQSSRCSPPLSVRWHWEDEQFHFPFNLPWPARPLRAASRERRLVVGHPTRLPTLLSRRVPR